MKEHYSPSDYKQNTWEHDDDDDEEESEETKIHTLMDEAYNLYERTYSWDLDEPLERKAFEERLRKDNDFAAVWGPRDEE